MQYKDFWFHGKIYIVSRDEVNGDGLWRDQWGVVYGLSDDTNTVDFVDRCGIGALSLPVDHPANVGCKAHDYKYTSPAYQKFHVRSEADDELEKDLTTIGYPIFGWFAKKISSLFGGRFWENKDTKDK